ncbi:MAG: glycyl-radical enzyme activating protein [Lachnospiraceae bacterium]|nr:glycyl-radical enzyme activating protein [Lachnospiraceae bacterium]
MNRKTTLLIFNIQKYSLHDGDGIRTAVFLKGCPLRCAWCCNPESQSGEKELIYRKTRCIGMDACGLCKQAAPTGAIRRGEDGKASLCMEFCKNELRLADVCPARALEIEGREITIDEVLQTVAQDEIFYRGKGGLTLSGGEPLFQKASIALLKEAKEDHINTAIETCGFVSTERLLEAAAYLDEIFFDLKSAEEEKHIRYTGVSNGPIIANLNALKKAYPHKRIRVRTPVIPGFNDTKEALSAIEAVLSEIGIYDWQKLPYHAYGVGKYEMLGRVYPLDQMRAQENF